MKQPGKYYDGGGLMLMAAPTRAKSVVNKTWHFRFQIDRRERYMGLGSARVVGLAEARAKANECRKLLAAGIDPLAQRNSAPAAIGTPGAPATIAAPTRSVWQTNCIAVRTLLDVTWLMRRSSGVAWMSGVSW